MNPSSSNPSRPENRLGLEKSPYLLQHRHNPVDWYPFGDEARARARAEDKPLFVSIGYSTCHWCHVMERESFENEAIAAVMNDLFINVKIDREERPDLDHIYMQAVMAMQGQGGWPLSVWLTPDLLPFYGGTYFPPAARYGRPGFPDLLRALSDAYRKRRGELETEAKKLVAWISARGGAESAKSEITGDPAARAAELLMGEFDTRFGGFGEAPKFPRPMALDLLAHLEARTPEPTRLHALGHTLDMMWRGGMYDHVGGGFARYSTDERWLVPHFEKMLYDNALLIEAYLDGHLLTGRDDFAHVASDIGTFIEREMTHADGGFFSAQDADSEGEEGLFYLFTRADFDTALGADAAVAAEVFGLDTGSYFEGQNILHIPRPMTEVARAMNIGSADLALMVAQARCKLYGYREARVRPGLDDKVLASWNGLMIHALARLGAIQGDDRWVALARRAATFIEREMSDAATGGVLRRWRDGEARFVGGLDDHVFLAWGHLGLFEATGSPADLARARALMEVASTLFEDQERGGYFGAAPDDALIARLKEAYDGALPSGNSMAALVLARLGSILGGDYFARARRTIAAFGADLARSPHGHPMMAAAWLELSEPPRQLFVLGNEGDPGFGKLLRSAHRAFMPGRVIIPVTDRNVAELRLLGVSLEGKSPPAAGATALLCEELACQPFPAGSATP